MTNPTDGAASAPTLRDTNARFLEQECGLAPADYDALRTRMTEWAACAVTKVAINDVNPVMLLEQVRREFDESVAFVPFALAAAELQWGPRLLKLPQFDGPVWVITIEGFPAAIEAAQKAAATGGQ